MVLRGWELRYNHYVLPRYAVLAMLPTTHAVFSQLTVLLFDYCILCVSQTEQRADTTTTSWLGSNVYT